MTISRCGRQLPDGGDPVPERLIELARRLQEALDRRARRQADEPTASRPGDGADGGGDDA